MSGIRHFLSKIRISAVIALMVPLAVSCVKPAVFPVEPYLEFRGNIITRQPDVFGDTVASLQVVFYFQDGDGDLGRKNVSETYPYVGDSAHDLHFTLYEHISEDSLVPVVYVDTAGVETVLKYAYRLKYFEPVNANGNLRGTIRWDVDDFAYTASSPLLKGKRVCYGIYLYDRALHKSNTIYTDPIDL